MKKRWIAGLCLLLILTLCLGAVLTGCKKDPEPEPEPETPVSEKKGEIHFTTDDEGGVEVDWNEQVGNDTKRY